MLYYGRTRLGGVSSAAWMDMLTYEGSSKEGPLAMLSRWHRLIYQGASSADTTVFSLIAVAFFLRRVFDSTMKSCPAVPEPINAFDECCYLCLVCTNTPWSVERI